MLTHRAVLPLYEKPGGRWKNQKFLLKTQSRNPSRQAMDEPTSEKEGQTTDLVQGSSANFQTQKYTRRSATLLADKTLRQRRRLGGSRGYQGGKRHHTEILLLTNVSVVDEGNQPRSIHSEK